MESPQTYPAPYAGAPSLKIMTGHEPDWIMSVAFSPDGSLLASTSARGEVIFWDTHSGEVRGTWSIPNDSVWRLSRCEEGLRARVDLRFGVSHLTFTPDGESVITCGNGIHLWKVRSGAWIGTIPGLKGPVVCPGDTGTMIGHDGAGFRVIDATSGRVLRSLPFREGLGTPGMSMAVAADGSVGAVTRVLGSEIAVEVFDLLTGARTHSLRFAPDWGHGDGNPFSGSGPYSGARASRVALSPEGRLLAMSHSRGLCLVDIETGSLTLLEGLRRGLEFLVFSPDAAWLAGGSEGGEVWVWHVPSGELRHHSRGIRRAAPVAFTPDGVWLGSASHSALLRVNDWECRRRLLSLDLGATGVAWSPGGDRVAVAYDDGTARLWNSSTGALERVIRGFPTRVQVLAFSPDGRHLLSGSTSLDGAWDTATGELVREPAASASRCRTCGAYLFEAHSPNGDLMASASGKEGHIRVIRRATGETLYDLAPLQPSGVVMLKFSSDGNLLAAGHSWQDVHVWDLRTGALLSFLHAHVEWVHALDFSPDGSLLAVGGAHDEGVVLCNLKARAGKHQSVVPPHWRSSKEGVTETQRTWPEQYPGEEIYLDTGHSRTRGVAFSPDGRTVATVAADAALKLWDPVTGQLRATLTPLPSHGEGPTEEWIAYTPEGYYVASPGADPCIRWQAGPELLPAGAYADVYRDQAQVTRRLSGR